MDNEIRLNKIIKKPQSLIEPPRRMSDIKAPPPKPFVRSIPENIPKKPEFRYLPPLQNPDASKPKLPQKRSSRINFLFGGLILLLISLGGSAYYFYTKSKAVVDPTSSSAQAKLTAAINEINKVALLPITDEPSLFVVSDPTQLKADAFFINSKTGDEMLLYPHIGRAYLYRPSTKQIINMMSFNPDTSATPASNSATASTTSTTSTATTSAAR